MWLRVVIKSVVLSELPGDEDECSVDSACL